MADSRARHVGDCAGLIVNGGIVNAVRARMAARRRNLFCRGEVASCSLAASIENRIAHHDARP